MTDAVQPEGSSGLLPVPTIPEFRIRACFEHGEVQVHHLTDGIVWSGQFTEHEHDPDVLGGLGRVERFHYSGNPALVHRFNPSWPDAKVRYNLELAPIELTLIDKKHLSMVQVWLREVLGLHGVIALEPARPHYRR